MFEICLLMTCQVFNKRNPTITDNEHNACASVGPTQHILTADIYHF